MNSRCGPQFALLGAVLKTLFAALTILTSLSASAAVRCERVLKPIVAPAHLIDSTSRESVALAIRVGREILENPEQAQKLHVPEYALEMQRFIGMVEKEIQGLNANRGVAQKLLQMHKHALQVALKNQKVTTHWVLNFSGTLNLLRARVLTSAIEKIDDPKMNDSKPDFDMQIPVHQKFWSVSMPTTASVSISDFVDVMPYRINFSGLSRENGFADGVEMDPPAFKSHDDQHTTIATMNAAKFIRENPKSDIPRLIAKLKWVVENRYRLPEDQRIMAEVMLFMIDHEYADTYHFLSLVVERGFSSRDAMMPLLNSGIGNFYSRFYNPLDVLADLPKYRPKDHGEILTFVKTGFEALDTLFKQAP